MILYKQVERYVKIPGRDTIEKINHRAEELLEQLDVLLARGEASREEVFSLVGSGEFRDLSAQNRLVHEVRLMVNAAQVEWEQGVERTLLETGSTEKLIAIYRELCLLLRRVETGLPEEYGMELAAFLQRERISTVAVLCIIQGTELIYNKDSMIEKVMRMMEDRAEWMD